MITNRGLNVEAAVKRSKTSTSSRQVDIHGSGKWPNREERYLVVGEAEEREVQNERLGEEEEGGEGCVDCDTRSTTA